jgi:cytidyltransferase-like protein
MKIVLVTGGFDPVHSGHIAYFKAARELGDRLIVGLNSDAWLERKKGRAFMPWLERANIIDNLSCVDDVYEFYDDDGTGKDAILHVREAYPDAHIIFANGGDRTADNIPEMDTQDSNLEFVFGVGGEDKKNSSSWILDEWRAPKSERQWGYYKVLHEVPGTRVKELTVLPGKKLSMQRHNLRAEHWHVSEGRGCVYSPNKDDSALSTLYLDTHKQYSIMPNEWHQLCNPFDVPCKIIEIQYGEACDENDIERR